MPTTFYPTGLGATSGSDIAQAEHFVSSRAVYYVDGTTGSSANSGLVRDQPKDKISGLIGNAGTTVVVLSNGCSEFNSNPYPLSVSVANVAIIGEGTTPPIITLTGAASFNAFSVNITADGDYCLFDNLTFLAAGDFYLRAGSVLVTVAGTGVTFRNCKFSLLESSSGLAASPTWFSLGAGTATTFIGCTFEVSGPAVIGNEIVLDTGAAVFLEDCQITKASSCTITGSPFTGGHALTVGTTHASVRNCTVLSGQYANLSSTTAYLSEVPGTDSRWILP